VKYLRFLKQLNQLTAQAEIKKSTHLKLWTWWQALTQADPAAAALISKHCQELQTLAYTPVVSATLLQARLAEFQPQAETDAETAFRYQTIEHLQWVVTQQTIILAQRQTYLAQSMAEPGQSLAVAALENQLQALAANQWLTLAISNGTDPPGVFADRPQYPSDFVSSWVARQLEQLVDARLVEVIRPTGTKGYSSACFYLSRTGRRQLAKYQAMLVREVPWKPVGTYAYTELEHRLAQSQFRVAFTLAAERQGYTLEWLDTTALEKRLKGITVELQRLVTDSATAQHVLQTKKSLRIPDDFVWLTTAQGQVWPLVIELDNASETISSATTENTLTMKYRTWSAFCQQGILKQYFKHCEQGAWHLTVTTGSAQRLRHLQAAALDVVGRQNPAKNRYWFCCLAKVKPTYTSYWAANLFTEPLWLRGDAQEEQVMDMSKVQVHNMG